MMAQIWRSRQGQRHHSPTILTQFAARGITRDHQRMAGISVLFHDRTRASEECRLHAAGSRFPIDTGAEYEGLVIL